MKADTLVGDVLPTLVKLLWGIGKGFRLVVTKLHKKVKLLPLLEALCKHLVIRRLNCTTFTIEMQPITIEM